MLAHAAAHIRRLRISRVKNTVTQGLVRRQFDSLKAEAETLAVEMERLTDLRLRLGKPQCAEKKGRSVTGLKNGVYFAQETEFLSARCLERERELQSLCWRTISRMEAVLTVYSGLMCRDDKLVDLIGKKQRELQRARIALERIDLEEGVRR